MGKEVYGGRVGGTSVEKELYHEGVSAGALGLVWYVLTLAITSLAMEPLVQVLGGMKQVWGLGNFLLAIGMAMTVVITYMADHARSVATTTATTVGNANYLVPPPPEVKWASLCLFALLGIPQAVVVAMVSGPLDAFFGGGNLPAFVMGGIAAALSGVFSLAWLST
ncbi:Sucrose transport protein SUC5 [Camellia lanceoleosa]|uniref:Sucrose transport protein SUC5 n=1 Tax=Camellia lanceoleosa TaxID=1840588 RepID=A0ACC0GX62_9ERIC|nr:Sucrose transport protein SUC5 [Camellia lanceoleosa]